MITIEVTGFDGFAATLQAATQKVQPNVAKALVGIGFDLHGDLVESLSHIGTGIVYTRGGITHIASAPGEPPAPDTGTYRSSWGVDTSKANNGEVSVFTGDDRGPWLEFGTADMAPRPHLGPAVERIRPKFTEILEAALGDTLEGS